ncbi:hypothetical protein ACFPRL_23735 [Pseudoclavibacter helvolus]
MSGPRGDSFPDSALAAFARRRDPPPAILDAWRRAQDSPGERDSERVRS